MESPTACPYTPGAQAYPAHNNDTPTEAREKRKRQPRNSACQACANLKMKCVPAPTADKCERCDRMDRECLPSVPKPRKRRTLDGEAGDSPRSVPVAKLLDNSVVAGASLNPAAPLHSQGSNVRTSLMSKPDLSHTGSKSFVTLLGQGLGIEHSAGDVLRGVDYGYVQRSLTVFRQLTNNFPFVALRPDADAISMVADRPVSTTAICAVASAAQQDVQERLAQAFRLALSTKVILQGEKSMDLLVGLLIFLAWHHNYMSKQQIYQEMYLLAGMAADLGLYRQPSQTQMSDVAAAMERDRAFLGCYYLCCGLSVMGFNKPSPLRWTDNLRRCAEDVAYSSNQASDRLLVCILELVHVIEDFEDALRSDSIMKKSTLAHYVEMHTKAASHRLKALKREHPELASALGFGATAIHFQHRLLRTGDIPDTSTLIQCACAIKEYIDDVLARPPITLHQIAIVDWTNLLEVLVLMAQVAKPLPNAVGWEAGALSSMLQPEAMLDAICAHMASAPLGDNLNPRHEAQLQWLRGVCDDIKRRLASGAPAGLLRNDSSQYDAVHSLGQNGAQADTGGRFRPVNEPYDSELPLPGMQEHPQTANGHGSFILFDNGVLDERFWVDFLRN